MTLFREVYEAVFSPGRLVFITVATTCFLVGALGVVVLDRTPRELPREQLDARRLRTYYYSLRRLREARPKRPVGVVLSASELTYLLQNRPVSWTMYGCEITRVHVSSVPGAARLRAVLRTPLGLFVNLDGRGRLRLDQGGWTLWIDELRAGSLPLAALIPAPLRPDWPRRFGGGTLHLHSLQLDARGFRARLEATGLDLESTLPF